MRDWFRSMADKALQKVESQPRAPRRGNREKELFALYYNTVEDGLVNDRWAKVRLARGKVGSALLGGLLVAAATALSDDSIKYEQTTLSRLPTAITEHPDWPLKRSKDFPVVVLPRECVTRFRYKWWSTFDIITAQQTFFVGLGRRDAQRLYQSIAAFQFALQLS